MLIDNLETYLNYITTLILGTKASYYIYILHKHRNLSEMRLCGCNLQRSYHKGCLFYVKAKCVNKKVAWRNAGYGEV